ncbi:MAG: phosphoribosylformylglycinamidine synthase subunit PurL [Candidatus Heimdallarchaeota archaeon]
MNRPFYVSVSNREGIVDPNARSVESSLEEFGISANVRSFLIYEIEAPSNHEIVLLCEKLLCDKTSQQYWIDNLTFPVQTSGEGFIVSVTYKEGVMDATGLTVIDAAKFLDIYLQRVRTGISYFIKTELTAIELLNIVKQSLSNDLINDVEIHEVQNSNGEYNTIPLRNLSVLDLQALSKELLLALNVEEMLAIQRFYQKLNRDPTDAELETIGQTWSEHCVHKTFKGQIVYEGDTINGLLKSYIMRATEEISPKWCVNVFSDNAGIIDFTNDYGLAVKVETHNHPSALDPYGGAGTGTGGVLRDAMGVGAKPILSTDCLFFGPLDFPYDHLPEGTMHPKRLMRGCVAGIRDYGNQMGVPTVNGCVGFHADFLGNPLVFAGVVGLLPIKKYSRNPQPGNKIVLLGGRTGRDGIHGVTFASLTLTSESEKTGSGAVQIGNPLEERRVLDALLKARDEKDQPLYSAITDCGGGGLSSAVGEMAAELGAQVSLDRVPLKYAGLKPWEIWISESQERMLLAVPPANLDRLLEICELENCDASVIGEFTDKRLLELRYLGTVVGQIDLDFLHKGRPLIQREARFNFPDEKPVQYSFQADYISELKQMLSHPTIASKEWVVRQYDHEVQGNTIIKPLQGINFDGHGDASVIKPLNDSWMGVVISNGFNPNYSSNPRKMALSSIDEAIRNNICSGGRRFSLLDNFSWGNPEDAENLGALVEACRACYESATALGSPFISGKDSLYNDFQTKHGETITIPHTLLITCVGIIPDIRKSITSDFKREMNSIYIIGDTYNELGGSMYHLVKGIQNGVIPDVPNPRKVKQIFERTIAAIDAEMILTCHDCSEGGIAVTLAEMCFGGNLGVDVNLRVFKDANLSDIELLFSESNSRFIVEVSQKEEFEKFMEGIPVYHLGYVKGSSVKISGINKDLIIDAPVNELKKIWQQTFAW